MSINQELLRTFVAAAESESFSKAAERRHVTKAAVSQQVKALEAQLGVVLFERSGGQARVTESGRELAAVLRRQFEVIDDAVEAVAASHRDVAGEVRIGAPGPFTRLWLRPRVARLLQAHAALRITVVFGTPRELERRLAARELDLVLLVRPVELPGIEAKPVFTERFHAYAAPSYLRGRTLPRTAADFAAHRFIVYDDDLPMHGPWWRASFGPRAPLAGQIVCRMANLDEMLALAEQGVGVAVLPDYVAEDAVQRRTIVELPRARAGRGSTAVNRIVLAWRKNAVPTARFRAVREALLA